AVPARPRRHLGLEVLYQAVVGAAQLVDLLRARRELRLALAQVLGQGLLGVAQPAHVAIELVVGLLELLVLLDQRNALGVEALGRGLEHPHALLEPALVACEPLALGDDLVIGAARHAAQREQRRDARGASPETACAEVPHRSPPRTRGRAPRAARPGPPRGRGGSAPAGPRARCPRASRRAPSP